MNYKEVEEICDRYNIKNWSINKDGLVDVDNSVNLRFENLEKLPLNFGRIESYFHCDSNKLTSLQGTPKEVGGDFSCHSNKLTNLEGAPKEVDGDFFCFKNNLTSLEGAPKEVGGDFFCLENDLTNLEGAPKEIDGNFYCVENNLTNLEGAPKKIGVSFYCGNNELTTLEGVPYDIKKLDCNLNPIYDIWKFIKNEKYLQEFIEVYDVVIPGKVVILEYLNDIRKLMGKEPVEREEIPDDWKILDI